MILHDEESKKSTSVDKLSNEEKEQKKKRMSEPVQILIRIKMGFWPKTISSAEVFLGTNRDLMPSTNEVRSKAFKR